jgi:hypothetical protein
MIQFTIIDGNTKNIKNHLISVQKVASFSLYLFTPFSKLLILSLSWRDL